MPDIFDKCDTFWHRVKKLSGDYYDESVFFRKFPITNCLPEIQMDGKTYLQIATNDYLGLATHPEVRKIAADVTANHLELERKLAEFRRTEGCLVFNLGLGAMSGTIACIVGRNERVFVDEYAHGCVSDGAKLCKGEATWFKHNDMEDLENQLKACPIDQPKLIAVDGVYGMTGDLAPLPALVELKNKYNAQLFVDDAHGTGVMGEKRLQNRLEPLVVTFVVPRGSWIS